MLGYRGPEQFFFKLHETAKIPVLGKSTYMLSHYAQFYAGLIVTMFTPSPTDLMGDRPSSETQHLVSWVQAPHYTTGRLDKPGQVLLTSLLLLPLLTWRPALHTAG